MTELAIPVITADDDNLSAAPKYAKAGFYIGPAKAATKNPGSVLGKGWQHKTSWRPQVIASWFPGTNHDVFIALRSRLVSPLASSAPAESERAG
jgi:hypothetical protein